MHGPGWRSAMTALNEELGQSRQRAAHALYVGDADR
jgi:hypothetical protein